MTFDKNRFYICDNFSEVFSKCISWNSVLINACSDTHFMIFEKAGSVARSSQFKRISLVQVLNGSVYITVRKVFFFKSFTSRQDTSTGEATEIYNLWQFFIAFPIWSTFGVSPTLLLCLCSLCCNQPPFVAPIQIQQEV